MLELGCVSRMKIRGHYTWQLVRLFVLLPLLRLLVLFTYAYLYFSYSFLTRPRLLTERRGDQDATKAIPDTETRHVLAAKS